jgi:hypothetical protein
LRPVLGAPILSQRPLDPIIDKSVLEHGGGMIKDQRVRFVRRRSQNAADHLPVKPEALCRPRQHQATHRRAVKPFGQNGTIRDNFNSALGKSLQDRVALFGRRAPVYVLGEHAGAAHLIADMNAVRDAGSKDDGLFSLTIERGDFFEEPCGPFARGGQSAAVAAEQSKVRPMLSAYRIGRLTFGVGDAGDRALSSASGAR